MKIWVSDKWKTAFYNKYNRFKYQVIFFGLSNTPASFKGYINKIPTEKLNVFVIGYLDNILTYTKKTSEPHVKVVC